MPTPTPDDWTQIRYDYEHSDRPLAHICTEHGISTGTLRDRMRRWGWQRRRPPVPKEGPPPVIMPRIEIPAEDSWPLGPRFRGDERRESWLPTSPPVPMPVSPTEPIAHPPSIAPDGEPAEPRPPVGWQNEPSPHLSGTPRAADDSALIVPRLQGAVAGVLPAIEATLGRLALDPMRPREMEQAARALGSLTRTLRELNGLLAEHKTTSPQDDWGDPPEDMDEFRNALAKRIRAIIDARDAERPARYETAWNEFAAEAAHSEDPGAGALNS